LIYLLDTNTCIQLIRAKGHPLVKARYPRRSPSDMAVCSIVVGELMRGAERSANPPAERAKVRAFLAPHASLSFDDAAAHVFATVQADLERRGLPIGPYDILIAAIALVHNLILVTHNTGEFSRIPGLVLDDWELP
jgi:tRNA(fMet)-specific endonuclease VapC